MLLGKFDHDDLLNSTEEMHIGVMTISNYLKHFYLISFY